jgi:hypothetical protein
MSDEYKPRFPGWKERTTKGQRRCQARKRRVLTQCGAIASTAKNVCRIHGANAGRPTTHGRYSKVGGRLAACYDAALQDASLLDLQEPIALLEAISQRYMERAAERDTPDFRRSALTLYSEAQNAQQKQDTAGMAVALNALGVLLREGADEDRTLKHLAEQTERLAKRIEGAWSVRLARQQAINAKDLVSVLSRLIDIVRVEADPATASSIIKRIDFELIEGGRELRLNSADQ